MKNSRLISIVVPVCNEENNLPLIYEGLIKFFSALQKRDYDYEIIFVNDGSDDKTSDMLDELCLADKKIKCIEFSRNFGKEIATSAGIYHAKGDAVIMIDADGQHPAELLPDFISKWEDGADIVIGVREKNSGEGFIKRVGSRFFYKIINAIGETRIVPQSTDYRLIDRKVAEELNRFTEKNRATRILIDWLGFKRDFIYFKANERKKGKASYGTLKLVKLALSSFVSHSLFPLKLAGYLGVVIIVISFLAGLFVFANKYILNDPWNLQFTSISLLALMILFLIGVVLACLGLIALYIANIHEEALNRPLYIVRKKKNF